MALPVDVARMGSFKGDKGNDGDKGDTGSLAFATSESVDASQAAAVEMVGPESNRGAHFRIPRGLPGVNAVPADEAVAAFLAAAETDTRAALMALLAPRDSLNILDYGVRTGTTVSQTAAILAACDAHPGRAFYFPPGDYRLDEPLVIRGRNSFILDPDARLYAGSAMGVMIDYSTTGGAITDFAWSKSFTGGTLDGNLLAHTILKISRVVKFALANVTFRDGIHRGLVTEASGAEIFANSLHFYNTSATNWDDNVALDLGMGDCHFTDVVVKDWTIAFRDRSSNKFLRCHGWLGNGAQLANRYPSSVCFDAAGNMDVIGPYSDTYRIALRARRRASDNAPARVRALMGTIYWAGANLPVAIAEANQSYVLDVGEGCDVQFDHNWMLGHGHASGVVQFATGTTDKLSSRDNRALFAISGVTEYRYGIQEGKFAFTPVLAGSVVAGVASYATAVGTMIVRDDEVRWMFRIKATLDNTIDGSIRIAGIPFPAGAASTDAAMGNVAMAAGIDASALAMGGASAGPMQALVYTRATGAATSATALRGATVEVWGQLTAPISRKPQD